MWIIKEKCLEQLNISNTQFELFNSLKMIKYSQKTDKYDINSLLEKRTMTIGIENLLTPKQKNILLNKMEKYSSCKHKLTKMKQSGIELKNSGKDRLHRQISKEFNLGILESDSCLKSVEGIIKSSETWYNKTITNLENRIITQEKQLENDLIKNKINTSFHPNYFKGKKKKIEYLKNKLSNFQGSEQLKIHYGKGIYKNMENCRTELFNETIIKKRYKLLHNIKRYKEEYQNKRLEYFVEGSVGEGNKKINIEKDENGNYEIRFIFGKSKIDQFIVPIKISNSHKDFFSLNFYNKQSNRISFNSKGKLVLHCTYSYIKPLSQEIQQNKKSLGTIGIDIGPKEITCVFVKNDGNPYKKIHYSTGNLLDKRSKDTKRNVSEILEKIIKQGINHGFYHITIENLNFDNHKYKYRNKTLNRLLSKFPFKIFEELIESKSKRYGINLRKINPKYTSLIGLKKYSYRSDISSLHNQNSKDYSRALVIGRRGLGFKERNIVSIRLFEKNGKSKTFSYNANSLLNESVKNLRKINHCQKSNWSIWNLLKKHEKEINCYFNSLTGRYSSTPLCA